jgi:NAD+ synthase
MQELAERLIDWLRDRARSAGASGLVFGMSGGVDSSVVAVLCKRALGGNTLGLLLPCHSIQEDIDHACLVAEKFAIKTKLVTLDPLYDSLIAILGGPSDRPDACNAAEANLKPRLRMTILYYFANNLNYLVVGSSNKCELGIGYFTKFGDSGADIMPLGNMVKRQVREMAGYLQIPDAIVQKAPSAGLWRGQTDEQEMGITYEELDRYFCSQDVSDEVRQKIEYRVASHIHKRVMPPVPRF